MRVALIHDWLTGMRGGERCLEAVLDVLPDAEIFTLLHLPGSVSARIEEHPIHTSFVASLPRSASLYRNYLPLFPAAIERFDLRGFDLVLSISHCVAKGVRVPAGIPHLSYCLTPMRYVWDLYHAYFGSHRASLPMRAAMALLARRLRRWDVESAERVDSFVACSRHIEDRIRRCYGRNSSVVYPPVSIERFEPAQNREDFYLVLSALVPYKRVDVVVQAFNRLHRRLIVIGNGPEIARLRRMAGPNTTFLGWLTDGEVADWLGRCRALVFSAEDDFGITAVEAQAAGAPVIAYAAGGAMETVLDMDPGEAPRADLSTGVFFYEQTPDAVIAAVRRFETRKFEASALRANARRFGVEQFQQGLRLHVDRLLGERATHGIPLHEPVNA